MSDSIAFGGLGYRRQGRNTVDFNAICDIYENANALVPLQGDSGYVKISQSFTGNGGKITSAQFYFEKVGSPTGQAVIKIYAHQSTFGTTSEVVGSALATSNTFDVATQQTQNFLNIAFSGINQIRLNDGTHYVMTVEYSGGDVSNYVGVGIDTDSPTHPGNAGYYSTFWVLYSEIVMTFAINTLIKRLYI